MLLLDLRLHVPLPTRVLFLTIVFTLLTTGSGGAPRPTVSYCDLCPSCSFLTRILFLSIAFTLFTTGSGGAPPAPWCPIATYAPPAPS